MMKLGHFFHSLLLAVIWTLITAEPLKPSSKKRYTLGLNILQQYVNQFNQYDDEPYQNLIINAEAFAFLSDNIPLIDIPDKNIEEIYYFRWWTYRKHIKRLPRAPLTFVVTEFLATVPWSGDYNTINCAAGHHFREGRWLHDISYLESYARFWFRNVDGGNPRAYSFWPANAILSFCRISGSFHILDSIYEALVRNYRIMVDTNYDHEVGLWFNTDNRDGMEMSAGGRYGTRAYRPTLNSYMIAEAMMLSKLARILSRGHDLQQEFLNFAVNTASMMERHLWDHNHSFYKAAPVMKNMDDNKNNSSYSIKVVSVRELHGYTPWYFNLLPNHLHLEAWQHITDKEGFYAPYGLTTAEQRHPYYAVEYSKLHECRWNGPSWPYATSITLTAMANIIQAHLYPHYDQDDMKPHASYLSKESYYHQLSIYAAAHHRSIAASEYGNADMMKIPWIDENIHPYSGDWISRTLLRTWENDTWSEKKGGRERGKDYNHSTFVDMILSGLIGFMPKSSHAFQLRPLIPRDKNDEKKLIWPYFCIDQLHYRGRYITIIYDETGSKYNLGIGLTIMVDGQVKKTSSYMPDRVLVRY